MSQQQSIIATTSEAISEAISESTTPEASSSGTIPESRTPETTANTTSEVISESTTPEASSSGTTANTTSEAISESTTPESTTPEASSSGTTANTTSEAASSTSLGTTTNTEGQSVVRRVPVQRQVTACEVIYNKSGNLTGKDLYLSNTIAGLFIAGNAPLLTCSALYHACENKIEEKQRRGENVFVHKLAQTATIGAALLSTTWSIVTLPIWGLPILYVKKTYPA